MDSGPDRKSGMAGNTPIKGGDTYLGALGRTAAWLERHVAQLVIRRR
jgi:hypothetical protein